MGQAVQLRRLSKRAVADRQFDRDDRHRVIFKHDDLKSIRQHLAGDVRSGRRRRSPDRGSSGRSRMQIGLDCGRPRGQRRD